MDLFFANVTPRVLLTATPRFVLSGPRTQVSGMGGGRTNEETKDCCH